MLTATVTNNEKDYLLNNYMLNFGPQHPAAHGVLRLVLEMDGEVIEQAEPHIGLLHRGTEKLIEYKNYLQALPYFDRLDYMAMLCQEHCYVLAVENLYNIQVPLTSQYLRVLFAELTRIFNHIMGVTAHAMDVGALTPFLWNFEEREKMMEFFERISGARMHSAFFTPGGVVRDIDLILLEDLSFFITGFSKRLNEVEEMLTGNRIWKQRLVDIGIVDKETALNCGFSGPLLRATGINWDLRKVMPYDCYEFLDFKIPVGSKGDSYDRFLVRMAEMHESISIIMQCLEFLALNTEAVVLTNAKLVDSVNTMESIINHFKLWTTLNFNDNIKLTNSVLHDTYVAIEAPKGEFAVSLLGLLSGQPYRCHIKAPGFVHLQAINTISRGHLLADLVTLLGSLDIVFGEIDK